MADCYLGEIRMFAGSYTPTNWVQCDGQLLSVTGNEDLFGLLGKTYGGDGVTTFGVPDLRGRLPMHLSTTYPLGTQLGTETVTLTESQLPAHGHAAFAQSAIGTADTPDGAFWAASLTARSIFSTNVATVPLTAMAAGAVYPFGGGQAHENMMPFFPLAFIMATAGIFPGA